MPASTQQTEVDQLLGERRGLFSLQLTTDRATALWQARAKLEAEAGDPQRARRSYESGYAAAPGSAPLLHAWAYFEMHQVTVGGRVGVGVGLA